MTDKNKKRKNDDGSKPSGLWAFVTDVRTRILGILAAGAAVYFTGLLPDYGKFDVTEKRVTFPAKVEIDPIIEPRFFWPLHRAHFLTEEYGETLRPVGDTELALPVIKERVALSKVLRPVTFEPVGVGTTNVKLRLKSASGRNIAEAVMRVIVQRHVDYDGVWKMNIGPHGGTAYLNLVPNTDPNAEKVDVYGLFVGDDKVTTGLITGKFDGYKFIGHAIFGDMPTRWHLNADTKREGAGLVAQGKAEIYAPTPEGWSPAGAQEERFAMSWQRPLRSSS